MKWKAHTRTAEKILEHFDALHFQKYEKDLINGIIQPDNEDPKDHYSGREPTILQHIRLARDNRLQYDTAGCFFHLGVAFHYIQDQWVGVDPGYDDHSIYLDLINRCTILDPHESLERYYPVKRRRVLEQFRALEKYLGKPLESEAEMKELINQSHPYENTAFLDLNISFRICYRVAELVLKTMYHVGLQEQLDLVKIKYEENIRQTEIETIRSIEQLEEKLEKLSQTPTGIDKIKKWQTENNLKQAIKNYFAQKHIKPILQGYLKKQEEICKSYRQWYNIDKPELNQDKILYPVTETGQEGFGESSMGLK